VPLEALIKSSKSLEESEEMERIEATNWGMIALRQNIQAMRLQGKYIMSTLNDMKDYQALRMGQFRKSMILFNLKDTLEDIKEMIKYKAE